MPLRRVYGRGMNQRLMVGVGAGLAVAMLVVVALLNRLPETEPPVGEVSAVESTTSVAPTSTVAPTPTETEAIDASTTSTTIPMPPASGVIVAATGVAGWSADGAWFALGEGELPARMGETYAVVRIGDEVTSAVSGEVGNGCEFVDGARWVDGVIESTWGDNTALAVAADWDVVPRDVELLSNDSETYRAIVADALAEQGLANAVPVLRQVIRADLEGDGVDEVIITAGHAGVFSGPDAAFEDGDYSIALLRTVVDGEIETSVLGFFRYDLDLDAPSIYLVTYRVGAVADLNGDGRMEVAVNDRYYEGAGTVIYDVEDAEPRAVLDVGCGV